MNPDQQGTPGKRKYRAGANGAKGVVVGEGNTQNNHFHVGTLAAVVLLLVASGAVAWWVIGGVDSSRSGNAEPSQAIPPGLPITSTTTAAPSTSSSVTRTTAAPIWYDLAKLRAVVWNNGFDPIDPVRIGASSYPASIVGYYQSSASDQNDKAVWAIGGQCTEFDAWVGKNTDSSGGGTGRFVIIGDDRELFSTELGPNDPATQIHIDITGVIRLTLFDTRHLQDSTNAWGRPRVLCPTAPSPPR